MLEHAEFQSMYVHSKRNYSGEDERQKNGDQKEAKQTAGFFRYFPLFYAVLLCSYHGFHRCPGSVLAEIPKSAVLSIRSGSTSS